MENVLRRIGQTAGRVIEKREEAGEKLSRQILEEIHEVKRRKACNERWFQMESDEDLVEACIYEREELAARYRYLLRQARILGIKADGSRI